LLAIVGPTTKKLTPMLRALAQREGIADRVVFTGMLTGDEKRSALAAADVWALATVRTGNAVVEALAASRAVVISPE
jgi:glycosyltransferase involved in cell wall biosynthesis